MAAFGLFFTVFIPERGKDPALYNASRDTLHVWVGAINTRSRPISWALRKAAAVGMTSVVPSGKTARTSRARIDSFTFSLRFCLRGGKFLGGNICDYALDSEGATGWTGALRNTGVPACEMT